MPYKVLLTAGAERDLDALHEYIKHHDSKASANHVLDRLLKIAGDMATILERGSHRRKLLALGIHQYRQVFFKPYRLIYRIIHTEVVVYLIAEGRRNMQTLLSQRLLGGPN